LFLNAQSRQSDRTIKIGEELKKVNGELAVQCENLEESSKVYHRHLLIFLSTHVNPRINDDSAELFESGFEVFDVSWAKTSRIGKIVKFYQAFVSQPEDARGREKTADPLTRSISGFCAAACGCLHGVSNY
jgi:hypothetical protein